MASGTLPNTTRNLLIDRYVSMLPANVQPRCEPVPGTRLRHIRWMLEQMRVMDHEPKFWRWLGFVQCRLILDKRTTVQAERDFTRPLLGAAALEGE